MATYFHMRVKSLTKRLLKSAPEAGAGLNEWLVKGARMCSDLEPDEAFNLLAEVVEAKGGEHDERAIWRAINTVLGTDYQGASTPKWPDPDLTAIEKLTLETGLTALATLESRSPEQVDEPTEQIIRRLFPGDPLLSAGFKTSTTVYSLSKIAKNLHKLPLIVPSPMLARVGLTQRGTEAGRCLSNTGPRRFLVTEFDFKRVKPDGVTPTIWVPLIDLWESRGITAQDAAAAIILHLVAIPAPLVMVVYSGSVSLHAWWLTAGVSEEEGSRLKKFMRYAAWLGADTQTYTRSQFVRMPNAVRETGTKQTVHYLDFKHLT
jgi:hypothetical protein